MRALFASTRGAGHLNPLLPVAREWRRHGHEALVAGPPDIAEAVARAGFEHWSVDPPPDEELGPVWARVPSLSPEEANEVVVAEIFATLNVRAALPRMREACERWRPDVVVRDPAECASALAAELHGVPHARVGISLVATEELCTRIGAAPVDAQRRELGLPPDPTGDVVRATPFLTPFPLSLEDPAETTQPDLLRFRDPGWDAPANPLPAWWEEEDRPLVYVTFGSIAGGEPGSDAVYRAAIEAVGALPVRALLTVGLRADADALAAAAAPNVRVERWVPQADVLPHASAVVCHVGSGSLLGALAAGLPVVAVPLFADQPINAARVAATGAGISVAPQAEAIRRAVEAVLADDAYRARARRIADELRAHAPIEAVVDRLIRVTT